MIGHTFGGMLLALAWPWFWPILAALAAVAYAAQRRADRDETFDLPRSRTRWLAELASLLIIPTAMLGVAYLLSAQPESETREILTVELSLVAVMAAQAALSAWLIWRHRQRWLGTVTVTLGFTWWCAGAALISLMAMTNNWL